MPKMRTGKLNVPIVFYEKKDEKGPSGQPVEILVETHRSHCAYKQQFIRDLKNDIGTIFENTTEVFIRNKQAIPITNDLIVMIRNVRYEIVVFNPDDATNQFALLSLKEVK